MLRHAFRASAAVLPAQRRAAASLFQRSFASYPAHEVVGLPGTLLYCADTKRCDGVRKI